jgi:hypothetical protein
MSPEDAPNFRSIQDNDCVDCFYSIMLMSERDELGSAYVCKKFDFRIPYLATNHICDDWKEEE